MGLRTLHQKLENVKDELYTLHFAEASIEVYEQKRYDLEYEIACLEELIEIERRIQPLRIGLMIFTVVGLILVLTAFILK
jgi:hypothetical protein